MPNVLGGTNVREIVVVEGMEWQEKGECKVNCLKYEKVSCFTSDVEEGGE